MLSEPLTILVVEDDPGYARLVEHMILEASPAHEVITATSVAAALSRAERSSFDAVLLDLALPDSAGLETVRQFTRHAPALPVVVLTSNDDASLAAGALKAGAQDYVRKDEVNASLLLRALRYAMERQRVSRALQHRDETLRSLFDASPLPIAVIDASLKIKLWNPAAERMFGWAADDVLGEPIPYSLPETIAGIRRRMATVLSGRSVTGEETRARRRDGQVFEISVSASPLLDDAGQIVGVTAIYKDITKAKRSEQALRESERRYRLLFESNPQPTWVYEAGTLRFLAVNDAAVDIYGYTREEFLARTLADILERQQAPAVEREARERQGLQCHRRKDGTRMVVQTTTHALTFDGRPAALSMAQDVTEQVRADERLRFLNEASALLNSADLDGTLHAVARLAAHSIADGAAILLVEERGAVAQAFVAHRDAAMQARLAAAAEHSRQQAIALPSAFAEVLETGRPHLARAIADADRARYLGRPFEGCAELFGSALIVPMSTSRRPFGVVVLASVGTERSYGGNDLATAADLGRRLALTVENARLMRQARELFEADLTGNFIATRSGEIVACNPAFADILRFPDDSILGSAMGRFFDAEEAWPEIVSRLQRDGRITPTEMELRAADQEPVQVLISAAGVFDERGTLSRVRGQVYDISAHKRVEAQLSQSQKIEAVGRLAGGIAHDFNNLLTIISGQAERLQEGLPPHGTLRRSADAVAQAAERASGLTQQLLAFSRRQVLAPKVLSLNALVKNVHGMLERVIGEDVQCILTLASDLGAVKADPGRLEQALLNLAVNARDAMPDGGTLTIATGNAVLDAAFCRDHPGATPGQYVRLSVSDNGCGMDAATRARVFEPFFTTKEVGKGTGLGLSTVYGVVKQSGGYIGLESEAGAGATFTIYLPVVDEAVPAALPLARAVPSGGTETILLVEDEDGVRELIEELLRMQGYHVLAASRGAEALQIAEFIPGDIDLLVTDVVMPQMSGRELAARVLERRPRTGVLFLSGYTDDAIAHHGILEPGAAFLQKPFATAELTRKIREILDRPHPS